VPEQSSPDPDIERYQRQLQSAEPRDRAEAVMQLGRLRAPGGHAALSAALSNDRSPQVREAAARALGLFGSADSLAALQRAAQSDEDREVRRSASYAADVIRTNLSRR
jgi:HEAT repeat protein